MIRKKGQLFVVSAPSGAGKTTLCNMLLKEYSNIGYSISFTTRPPRNDEKDGAHYHFISKSDFEKKIEDGDFVEYALVHENYYGTSKKVIEDAVLSGRDILLDIDPQGAMQLKKKMPYGIYIFVIPPSIESMEERLLKRNDTAGSLGIRLKNAVKEVEYIDKYDYLIINDNLVDAYREMSSIYIAEKCRPPVYENLADEVRRRFKKE